MNPMKDLEACGQSPWLDDLHKTLMSSGELAESDREGRLEGPDLEPLDLREGDRLDQRLRRCAEGDARQAGKADDMTVYETIAIADIQAAADAFRGVYDKADGADGFVSLEVAPTIANDTEATKAGRHSASGHAVDRPNLMIKIPGTDAGTPAIQATIAEGINVNVTLLFAVKAYEDVAHAYIAGPRRTGRQRWRRVARRLRGELLPEPHRCGRRRQDRGPEGRRPGAGREDQAARSPSPTPSAPTSARKQIFSGARDGRRWPPRARIRNACSGPPPARSRSRCPTPTTWTTSSGSRHGQHHAARHHEGLPRPRSRHQGFDRKRYDVSAEASLDCAWRRSGISLDEITHELVLDGIKKFEEAFDNLLGGVKKRRGEFSKAA